MSPNRKIPRTFGVLLIASLVFGMSSSVPAIEASDFLVKLSSMRVQVIIAALSQCAMAVAYTCIAVLLYPLVKRYNEAAALAFFAFRIIGAVFLFLGVIALLSLLFLSETAIVESKPDLSHLQTIGELLRVARDWCNHVCMILPWTLGGLILYFAFYRVNLIPAWLCRWGLIGSALTLAATLLLITGSLKIATIEYFVLNAPTALFEIALAVSLLTRGFNRTALLSALAEKRRHDDDTPLCNSIGTPG
jgi:hypothetical protein